MKKFLFVILFSLMTFIGNAQNDVTKFLKIPVDGSKIEMISKLEAKGFKYNSKNNVLQGEFNGTNVNIYVITNNRKVCRITVQEQNSYNEAEIRIRFNNLLNQFKNNKNYITDYAKEIDESEDISYEIIVHNKRYEAAFYQISSTGKNNDENLIMRSVWLMISEQYGRYYIYIYYDNEYNRANGEDL